MIITRANIREIAQIYLGVLDKEGIKSADGLEKLAGQAIPIDGREEDYIIANWGQSNAGTTALGIAYTRQRRGLDKADRRLLDLRLNKTLGYAKIFLRCQEIIPEFRPFTKDPYGNIVQESLLPIDWEIIQGELRRVRDE